MPHSDLWERNPTSYSGVNSLTIGLSHYHCEVFHGTIGVAEPAAVESKVDGRFAN